MPLITTTSAASVRGLGFCKQTGPRTQPISGYELWLDSSDAATFTYSSGSVISRWVDKSPSAYFFEPSSTTYAPSRTGTQNGKSTVVFDGVNDFLISTASAAAWKFLHDGTQSTVIIVYKHTRSPSVNISTDYTLLDTTGYQYSSITAGYPGYTFTVNDWYYTSTSSYYSGNDAYVNSGVIQSGQSYPAYISNSGYLNEANRNTWNISQTLFDPNNATAAQKLVSYQSQATNPDYPATSVAGNGWTTASTSSPSASLRIGWDSPSSSTPSFKGEVAEIIMYKRKLSLSELSEMKTYLKTKWNI